MSMVINDITKITRGLILQQVNLKGVMGAGIALAIRKKWPVVYEEYRKVFKQASLGMIHPIKVSPSPSLWVVNLFAQEGYGHDKRHTDYNALKICLKKVSKWRSDNHKDLPIYIPYKMSCGNAGGNWETVCHMIQEIIPDAEIVNPPETHNETKIISSFRGKHAFLSNFYLSPITVGEITYPTVEHFYQAMKTENITLRKTIAESLTPAIAKRKGRHVLLRKGWEDAKNLYMMHGLILKFTIHPDLRNKLAMTAPQKLVEGNTWGDKYWGM